MHVKLIKVDGIFSNSFERKLSFHYYYYYYENSLLTIKDHVNVKRVSKISIYIYILHLWFENIL